jgi:hypothetical protein
LLDVGSSTRTVLINGQPGHASSLQTGASVSLHIQENANGHTADQVNAQTP